MIETAIARFVVPYLGVRDIKDAMSRDIIEALDAAGIGIASATYDIVGMPPVRVRREHDAERTKNGKR